MNGMPIFAFVSASVIIWPSLVVTMMSNIKREDISMNISMRKILCAAVIVMFATKEIKWI